MTAASPGELAGTEREGSGKQHEGATVKCARNTESLASREASAAGCDGHGRARKADQEGSAWRRLVDPPAGLALLGAKRGTANSRRTCPS